MVKYHINRNTQRPNICRADVKRCPVGGEHFETKKEAHEFIEKKLEKEYGESKTLNKLAKPALFSATELENGAVRLSSGQVLSKVHDKKSCSGERCPLHNPSNHKLRDLPLYFNGSSMVRLSKSFPLGMTVDPDDYVLNHNGSVILKNSARCLSCNEEIVSSSQHTFVRCSCKNVFVDGGLSYIRQGAKDTSKYENTSVIETKEN